MSEAANELELLERVLLRLGSADTDEQLETCLNKFLSPVLIKITSPHESVRVKVMEILTHVNKRLKSRAAVKIQLEPLLKQFQESNSSFLINFAIIYITMGFPRLDTAKQTELASVILNSLEGKSAPLQDKLLILILPLLGEIKMSDNADERKKLFELSEKPNTRQHLLAMLLDVLLLPYGVNVADSVEPPPGMSTYSFKRVNLENKKAEYLEQLKQGIVRFLCSGVLEERDVVPHLIVASADTRFSVATPALNELNKICSSLDWFDAKIAEPLYTLFSGNNSKVADRKTSGCSIRIKQKILQHLLKCRGNAINVARGIQVIFEGIFGEVTNQKCKVASLQFASNLISYGQKTMIVQLAKVLLTGINKLIKAESTEGFDVQGAAYNAISKLIAVCPDIFNKDVNLVVQYFNNMVVAPVELHNNIRDALVALSQAWKWELQQKEDEPMEDDDEILKVNDFAPNSSQLLLLGLLTEQADSKVSIIQNIASVFLVTCFPSHYVPARYLLLVLCGGSPSLREVITAYLYGVSRKDHIDYNTLVSADLVNLVETSTELHKKVVLPSFKAMIHYVDQMAEKKLSNPLERYNYNNHKLAFHVDVYTELLEYLRYCLWYSAGSKNEPGKDNDLLTTYIHQLADAGNIEHISKYTKLTRNFILAKKGFVELSCLADLLNAAPEIITNSNLDLIDILNMSLKEISETNRTLIAKILGVLVAYGTDDAKFKVEMKNLLNLQQKTLELQHGSILAFSNTIYNRILFYEHKKDDKAMESLLKSSEFKDSVDLLVKMLTDNRSLLTLAAVKGLSLIGCLKPLPLDEEAFEPMETDAKEKETDKDEKMEVDESPSTKNYVFKTVFRLLKSSQTKQKIRESSAHCLGHLAIGDRIFFAKNTLISLLSLKKMNKDSAIHIAMAQGLVFVVNGDQNLCKGTQEHDEALLEFLIAELIKIVPEVNVCSRQAVALWLLAVVKSCSHRNPILQNRKLLQMAFKHLLSEDNDLVQDVAARGLGIIFSISGEEDQNELSSQLLEQLQDGKKGTLKVSEDSVIFEEGVLGKAPSGANVSTYKELCSLATDLGQPEVIYQFLQLANQNASWNSKLGAAFGLQSISKVSKTKMQSQLGKIVGKLYHYKYDPTPRTQNSMIAIWDSIVVDSKSTVDQYYWEILNYLIKNLDHPEWRTRIACCLATRDLIRSQNGLRLRTGDAKLHKSEKTKSKVEKMEVDLPEPELLELWKKLFRVMDDIHEGTRETATSTTTTLAKLCVVSVSSDHGKGGVHVSASILPFLLEIGVIHTVAEVRRLSIKTVSEMIDSAGSLILPHLSELIPCLLRATGELDNAKLSQLSTMYGAHSGTQEMLDSVRAEAAKSHYTMETLTKCIKFIDYQTLERTTPAVLDLIKTSVNLGTKISTAHFICLTSVHLGKEMQPLVGKYLSACLGGLVDRNGIVRKYYASAIGHLIILAKEQTVMNLFKKLTTYYFEDQTAKSKSVVLTLNAINKKHSDIIKDYSTNILALIFFAKHEAITEENKSTVEMWQELWNDINFGESLMLSSFSDIFAMLESSLNSSSWLLKAQSGNAINTLAKKLDAKIPESDRIKLIELVLNNISGRTFNGKESLVEAMGSLCSKDLQNKDYNNKMIEAVLKECRKEEAVYRTKVVKTLGDILEKMDEENRFEEVYNMLQDILDKQSITSKDDDEAGSSSGSHQAINEERNKNKVILIKLKEVVCETLGKSWPTVKAKNSIETQQKYQLMLIVKLTECLKVNTRQIQVALMVALARYLEKLHLLQEDNEAENKEKKQKVSEHESDVLHKICDYVMISLLDTSMVPHKGLQKEALQSFLILVKKLKARKSETELNYVRQKFSGSLISNFQKDSSPEIKLRLQDINEQLKN